MANLQFVVYYMPQPGIEHFRLGISVSKKIGNAVTRNRLRRVVKEIVRHHSHGVKPGTDFILIARKPAAGMDYSEIEKSIVHVLSKAGIYRRKGGFPK